MKERVKFVLNILALSLIKVGSIFFRPLQKKGVALIRTDNLGDLIIFTPVLEKIAEIYNEKITLVVSEANYELAVGLQERGWHIQKVLLCDRFAFNKNIFYKIWLLWKIQKCNFSTVIAPAFSRNLMTDTLVAASNASERIAWEGDLLNQSMREKRFFNQYYTNLLQTKQPILKEVERNNELLKFWGEVSHITLLPHILPLDADCRQAEIILKKNNIKKRFIIISPGAGASYRIWPLDRFSKIIEYCFSLGYDIVLCGSVQEKKLAIQIASQVKTPIINLMGKTPIFILAALLKKSTLFFGNESGIAHLAAAVGTPVVCIMGGGHFNRFFPYGNFEHQQIVFEPYIKCLYDNWQCGIHLPKDECSPCIRAVSIAMVKEKLNIIFKGTDKRN
jgi:ADP-heptose:LPS heptosyltransferase